MEALVMDGLYMLLGFVEAVFEVLFFWLPADPLMPIIEDWQLVSEANAQAVRWLNWFVDVPFYSSVFALFVTVFLAFAAWKVVKVIVNATFKAVESVPIVE